MKLPKEAKPRKSWGNLNPVTKVVDSDKKYKRSKEKREVRKEYGCIG